MNEYKAKKVMEILERVFYINSTKGTGLVADLREDILYVYDTNNDCKPIMDYKGITSHIYFTKYWDNYFDGMVEAMHEALDKYLEDSNE